MSTGDRAIVCDNPDTSRVIEDALASLWSVANKLSKIKPAKQDHYSVTIFGSARTQKGHALYEDVKELARVLSELGCDIVTGGGPGLMQAANEGSQLGDPENKLRSVGIRIALPFEQGANPFVEQLYTHETFYTRLHHFVRLSHAFVVVGGGIGTTLEMLLVWQLMQVRHVEDVPFILVGDMWRELVDWAKRHMLGDEPPLADPEDMRLPVCVPHVSDALEHLRPRIAAFGREG